MRKRIRSDKTENNDENLERKEKKKEGRLVMRNAKERERKKNRKLKIES